MMRRRLQLVGLGLAMLAGCDRPVLTDREPHPSPVIAIGAKHTPAECGTITGRVLWTGPMSEAASINGVISQPGGKTISKSFPNPNAVHADPQSHAVPGAVVCLEGVEDERSRPWDHAPIRVEIDERRIGIVQGDRSEERR